MPPESTNTNIYHLDAKARKRLHIDMLPGTLMEANAALLKDEILCNVLGDHVVTNLSRIAEIETDAFRLAVHPWELDRYLATY
jgi:glutamine synthetase